MEEISYNDTEAIKDLFTGRKIVKAEDSTLTLDNGVTVQVVPNDGCWMCINGNYSLTQLNKVKNVITNVEVVKKTDNDDNTVYKIFVYAEGLPASSKNKKKLVEVSGADGNGYYGTGYILEVTR